MGHTEEIPSRCSRHLTAYDDTIPGDEDFLDVELHVGNGCGKASNDSDRLVEIFDEIQQSIAYCLRAAVKARQLRPATKYDELASFLYSSLQGAILQAKAERSVIPLERFKKLLFSTVLR